MRTKCLLQRQTASMAGIPKVNREGLAIPVMVQRSDPSKKLDDLAPFDPKANDDFNALQAQIVRWVVKTMRRSRSLEVADLDLGSAQANDTYQTILGLRTPSGRTHSNAPSRR